jgi:hypothetical protein
MPDTAQFEQLRVGTQPDEEEAAAYRRHIVELAIAPVIVGGPFPAELWLGALRDGRLRVVQPFRVRISSEGPQVIAEAPEVDEFGFGSNPSEALTDLQRALASLYLSLDEEQQRLGPDLARVWQTLREKISRRR